MTDGGVEQSLDEGRSGLGRIGSPARGITRLVRWKTRHIELRTKIASLEAELDVLEATTADSPPAATARIRVVRELLADARDRLDRGRVEEAWGQYHGASRIVVFVYDDLGDEETLAVRIRTVYEEAREALAGAPRRTAMALLGDGEGPKSAATAAELAGAMFVLHDQYERVALTRQYLQSQFNQLFVQGSVSLVLVFLLAVAAEVATTLYPESPLVESNLLVTPLTTTELKTVGFALYVALVGVLAASVFGMLTLRDQPLSTRTARRTPGLAVTGARVFVGATSALFLVFVLFTELLTIKESVTAPLALAIAFVGGYSERLAPQAVETVSRVIPVGTSDGTDERSPPGPPNG